MANYKLIGKDYTTTDLRAKVTGQAKYAEDFRAEGMVFLKLLLSPMPHARVRRLDAAAALAMPGVEGILTADDLPEVDAPNEAGLTNEPLYEGEPILAIAAVDEQSPIAVDLINLAIHTGCRKGELLELEWSRVDLSQNEIYLDTVHTKNSKPRIVAINSAAREALIHRASIRAEHCPDSPWVFVHTEGHLKGRRVMGCRKAFNSACRRAGIKDFTFHDLRHTCASWLVEEGVHLLSVRDVLGHSTTEMTERYAHMDSQRIHDAVAVLDGSRSQSSHTG